MFLPKSNNRRIHRTSPSPLMQICFPCSPARQVIRIFFIHHCQPLSWLRGGGAAWALSWTPGDLSIKRLPQAKNLTQSHSVSLTYRRCIRGTDRLLCHSRSVSAVVNRNRKFFRREDGSTCYYMQMKWDSPSSSSSFFFCAAASTALLFALNINSLCVMKRATIVLLCRL